MHTNIVMPNVTPQLAAFVAALPEAFAHGGEVIYSKRNEVRVFVVEGQRVVVKRYKRPNLVQRLTCSLGRRSKGRRAYLYAQRLLSMGIDTPMPIASVDCYCGLIYEQGYFVSAEDNRPDCRCIRDGGSPDGLAEALAQYIAELHSKGFLHGDTNLSNFLYETMPDGAFRFAVIDVNRSRFVKHPSRDECVRNLTRLTHDREAMRRVVAAYARVRHWDEAATCAEVEAHVRHFEQRRRAKHQLKRRR